MSINSAKKGFWSKMKRVLNVIPFAKEAIAMYYCMIDENTPVGVKITIGAALAYFISPLDVVPDFIPVAGYADDAGVIATAFSTVEAFVTSEHREKARKFING